MNKLILIFILASSVRSIYGIDCKKMAADLGLRDDSICQFDSIRSYNCLSLFYQYKDFVRARGHESRPLRICSSINFTRLNCLRLAADRKIEYDQLYEYCPKKMTGLQLKCLNAIGNRFSSSVLSWKHCHLLTSFQLQCLFRKKNWTRCLPKKKVVEKKEDVPQKLSVEVVARGDGPVPAFLKVLYNEVPLDINPRPSCQKAIKEHLWFEEVESFIKGHTITIRSAKKLKQDYLLAIKFFIGRRWVGTVLGKIGPKTFFPIRKSIPNPEEMKLGTPHFLHKSWNSSISLFQFFNGKVKIARNGKSIQGKSLFFSNNKGDRTDASIIFKRPNGVKIHHCQKKMERSDHLLLVEADGKARHFSFNPKSSFMGRLLISLYGKDIQLIEENYSTVLKDDILIRTIFWQGLENWLNKLKITKFNLSQVKKTLKAYRHVIMPTEVFKSPTFYIPYYFKQATELIQNKHNYRPIIFERDNILIVRTYNRKEKSFSLSFYMAKNSKGEWELIHPF